MKLAILSDIHGNLLALQAVLADVALQDVDQILNLGDIASGPLQPAETLDLLMTHNFLTIAGNHERQLLTRMAQANEPSDPTTSAHFDEPLRMNLSAVAKPNTKPAQTA